MNRWPPDDAPASAIIVARIAPGVREPRLTAKSGGTQFARLVRSRGLVIDRRQMSRRLVQITARALQSTRDKQRWYRT